VSIQKLMPGEFEFIKRMKSRYDLRHVGDDCAILPKDDRHDMVITADLLVEDIDFRLKWATPRQLGHKALAVSLSDIAAMGGDPNWAMLSIGLPSELWKTGFAEAFYEGWHDLAAQFGVEMVGGDISRTPDKVVVDSIAGGEVSKGRAIKRSGAKPGDAIYLSGPIGGAAGGLRLLDRGRGHLPNALTRSQLEPMPQVVLGNYLLQHEIATSMIDISDGLASDLNHLCSASGVGARIDRSSLPIDENLTDFFPDEECLDLALNGGEDFELLYTTAAGKKVAGSIRIGEVTNEIGLVEMMTGSITIALQSRGFRHF
jgi:thiamine-monophosphate kinase